MKKIFNFLFSIILIFFFILIVFMFCFGEVSVIGVLRMYNDVVNVLNIYYFVGMVYFEVWKKVDGIWMDGKKLG